MYPVETNFHRILVKGRGGALLNAFPTKTIMAGRADCAEMLLQSEKLSPRWPSFSLGAGRRSWGLRSDPQIEQ